MPSACYRHEAEESVSILDSFVHLAQSNLASGATGGAPAAAPATDAAQATAAAAPAAPMGGGDGWTTLIFFGAMILVFWLLIFRPQQKKQKEHAKLLDGLNRGDSVLTTSGIYGKVVAIADNVVTVEIAPNVRVKMLKSQVAGRASSPDEGGTGKDKDLVEKG